MFIFRMGLRQKFVLMLLATVAGIRSKGSSPTTAGLPCSQRIGFVVSVGSVQLQQRDWPAMPHSPPSASLSTAALYLPLPAAASRHSPLCGFCCSEPCPRQNVTCRMGRSLP